MNLSQEDEADMLNQLSHDKAVELLPVSLYVFVMMVTGLCGNVLVCVFYCKKGRITPTTRLIVAVAVIDTIICILMPKNIADLSLSYKFTSSVLCKLNNFINHTTALSSAMVLVAVAAFRFRAVCRPFSTQFTLRHANISIVIAIVVSILFSIPVLVTHESVPINVTVTSDLTIVGYDCNTSKRSSLKPLNLAVNVLHFFIFISTTITFTVLYGKMSKNIMKYYRTKKMLTGKTATRVYSTSDHTSRSDFESGSSHTGITDDDICEKKDRITDTVIDENLKEKTDVVHQQHEPTRVKGELNENGVVEGTDVAEIDISVKELGISGKSNGIECPETTEVDDESDENRKVKHTLVKFDEQFIKSERKDRPGNAGREEQHKMSAVAARQTVMLFIITVIFFLSFLPYLAMNISRTLSKNKDGDDDFTNWIQFCTRSYLINSAANPFVYGLFNTEFRNFVKQIFCRCCNGKTSM